MGYRSDVTIVMKENGYIALSYLINKSKIVKEMFSSCALINDFKCGKNKIIVISFSDVKWYTPDVETFKEMLENLPSEFPWWLLEVGEDNAQSEEGNDDGDVLPKPYTSSKVVINGYKPKAKADLTFDDYNKRFKEDTP